MCAMSIILVAFASVKVAFYSVTLAEYSGVVEHLRRLKLNSVVGVN